MTDDRAGALADKISAVIPPTLDIWTVTAALMIVGIEHLRRDGGDRDSAVDFLSRGLERIAKMPERGQSGAKST
jgi:hypothetical protein